MKTLSAGVFVLALSLSGCTPYAVRNSYVGYDSYYSPGVTVDRYYTPPLYYRRDFHNYPLYQHRHHDHDEDHHRDWSRESHRHAVPNLEREADRHRPWLPTPPLPTPWGNRRDRDFGDRHHDGHRDESPERFIRPWR